MKNGIYRIRNLVNDKCYIGSAADVRGFPHRWGNHRHQLRQQQHHSIKLQAVWNKYGEDAFTFEILLYCDPMNCLMYEQLILDIDQPAYNICRIAGSPLGYQHTTEAKRKIGNAHRGEKNNTTKLTHKNVMTVRELLGQGQPQRSIAKLFGVCQGTVSQINTGKIWRGT